MAKLSYRKLCVSKLWGLGTFNNIPISFKQIRNKNWKDILWYHEKAILEVLFLTLTENICRNKWNSGASGISTPKEIAVEGHFHVQHSLKTTLVFLPADGKASWLLLSSSNFQVWSLFLYALGNRSCLRKLKKDKNQH